MLAYLRVFFCLLLLSLGLALHAEDSSSLPLLTSKIPNWALSLRSQSCSQVLMVLPDTNKLNPRIKNKNEEISLEEYLRSFGLKDEALELSLKELEIIIDQSGFFKNALLSHLVFKTLKPIFNLKDDVSTISMLQKFLALRQEDRQFVIKTIMDKIAILMRASVRQEPEKMASMLNLSLKNYLEIRSFWDLYSQEDPALLRLEVAVRYILEANSISMQNDIKDWTQMWRFNRVKSYDFNPSFRYEAQKVSSSEHLNIDYSFDKYGLDSVWTWQIQNNKKQNIFTEDSGNWRNFNSPYMRYLILRYSDRMTLEFCDTRISKDHNFDESDFIYVFVKQRIEYLKSLRQRQREGDLTLSGLQSRHKAVEISLRENADRTKQLTEIIETLKKESENPEIKLIKLSNKNWINSMVYEITNEYWINAVAYAQIKDLKTRREALMGEIESISSRIAKLQVFEGASSVQSMEEGPLTLKVKLYFDAKKEEFKKTNTFSQWTLKTTDQLKDLEIFIDNFGVDARSSDSSNAILAVLKEINVSFNAQEHLSWLLWFRSRCRGLALNRTDRGRVIDQIQLKLVTGIFSHDPSKILVFLNFFQDERAWSSGKPSELDKKSDGNLNKKVKENLEALIAERQRMLSEKEELEDQYRKLRRTLIDDQIKHLNADLDKMNLEEIALLQSAGELSTQVSKQLSYNIDQRRLAIEELSLNLESSRLLQ
ncbi:MAG: hypothetical protein KA116_11190 [Proteobacteria bacterium]|nr:hypothetical protein [Pseudomonadota bacterium]